MTGFQRGWSWLTFRSGRVLAKSKAERKYLGDVWVKLLLALASTKGETNEGLGFQQIS